MSVFPTTRAPLFGGESFVGKATAGLDASVSASAAATGGFSGVTVGGGAGAAGAEAASVDW